MFLSELQKKDSAVRALIYSDNAYYQNRFKNRARLTSTLFGVDIVVTRRSGIESDEPIFDVIFEEATVRTSNIWNNQEYIDITSSEVGDVFRHVEEFELTNGCIRFFIKSFKVVFKDGLFHKEHEESSTLVYHIMKKRFAISPKNFVSMCNELNSMGHYSPMVFNDNHSESLREYLMSYGCSPRKAQSIVNCFFDWKDIPQTTRMTQVIHRLNLDVRQIFWEVKHKLMDRNDEAL